MAATLGHLRAGLYTTLFLFSLTVFILCAVFLNGSYSNRLNGGVAELLCATLLTLIWCVMILCTCFVQRFKDGFPSFYWEELVGLTILWALWFGGAIGGAVRHSYCWGGMCDVHIVIIVFAWLGTTVLTTIVMVSARGMVRSIKDVDWRKIFEERLPNTDEGQVKLPADEESDPLLQG